MMKGKRRGSEVDLFHQYFCPLQSGIEKTCAGAGGFVADLVLQAGLMLVREFYQRGYLLLTIFDGLRDVG